MDQSQGITNFAKSSVVTASDDPTTPPGYVPPADTGSGDLTTGSATADNSAGAADNSSAGTPTPANTTTNPANATPPLISDTQFANETAQAAHDSAPAANSNFLPSGEMDAAMTAGAPDAASVAAPLDFSNAFPRNVAPTYASPVVTDEQDTSVIPKETVGFDQVEESATKIEEPATQGQPQMEAPPQPQTQLQPEPAPQLEHSPQSEPTPQLETIQPPDQPTANSDPPQPEPSEPSEAPQDTASPAPSSANSEASSDGEKSPLEILEEILAEANSEKTKQTEEEQQKLQKEQEEAKFKAELAAKEAAYRQEASVQMEKTKLDLESAKQQRDQVQEDLTAQGKVSEQTPDVRDEALAIHQLEHDKVQQTT